MALDLLRLVSSLDSGIDLWASFVSLVLLVEWRDCVGRLILGVF